MLQRKPQGFATMTAERRREVSRKGGASATRYGERHRFTSEEARAAGLRGGAATKRKRLLNRSLAVIAGRLTEKENDEQENHAKAQAGEEYNHASDREEVSAQGEGEVGK